MMIDAFFPGPYPHLSHLKFGITRLAVDLHKATSQAQVQIVQHHASLGDLLSFLQPVHDLLCRS